jgi:hypothetical protein
MPLLLLLVLLAGCTNHAGQYRCETHGDLTGCLER